MPYSSLGPQCWPKVGIKYMLGRPDEQRLREGMGWAGEGEVAGPIMLGQGGRESLAVQWLGLSAFNL